MATKQATEQPDKLEDQLANEAQSAWDALTQIRSTWDDKERALLAQVNDSYSGTVVRARVTDAALSTLAFERQARVAAQLPTGRAYSASKKDAGKAKLMNIVLNNYIIPNAGRDYSMEVLQRLAGLYASVFGSVAVFYDYCVEDDYIGPYASLVDPRCFLPQPGFSSTKTMDWCMISTTQSVKFLEDILEKKVTSWDKKAIKDLIKKHNAKDAKPTRDGDSNKDSVVSRDRYTKEQAKGRIELITKYERGEKGRWMTFAPDYKIIIRNIPNPHKSGRIPIEMRHCFPLMNSIYGLGDFERGIRLQKAKDSLLGLYLEGAKQRIFPPTLIDASKATVSTIKNQANARWFVNDMANAPKFVNYGNDSTNNFQSTWGSLQSMLMNQFGTTDTSINQETSGNPTFGKTPEAIKMQSQRENARDNWDRAMHEECWQAVYEGMINLLSVKMEKPINFMLFEEEIQSLSKEHEDLTEIFADGKAGKMTLSKSDLAAKNGFRYLIDANSSMKQDDEQQFAALSNLLQMMMSNPNIIPMLQQSGFIYDLAEHIKLMFISSGIQDWERILQEQGAEGANQQAAMPPPPPPPDITHLQDDPELYGAAEQILQTGMQPQMQPQMGIM